jgi:methylated-DNA-protein-cysteine methyltransferase-like protein
MSGRVVNEGFHARVFSAVRQVPRGKVATYGQIATLLGSPRVARHVGWALAACGEAEPPVPWHRVINAQGRISGRGELMRAEVQRERLEAEGVDFDHRDRVDLGRFRWSGAGFELPEEPLDPG